MKYSKTEPVQFNSSTDYYGCFGNMSGGNRIKVCGYDLHGSEILYQCLKYTTRPDLQKQIIASNHPLKAKWKQKPFVKQGFVDNDFETYKVEIMKLCLIYKYKSSVENNTDFHRLLLSTNEANIIEVSKKDNFWGVKDEGDFLVGENMLGRCLMWLRSQMRQHERVEEVLAGYVSEYPYLETLTLCGKKLV
jgi:ribA/ribD-fused uncharacterized protein